MSWSVLVSSKCASCVYGAVNHYNVVCAHCPDCHYSKRSETNYLNKDIVNEKNKDHTRISKDLKDDEVKQCD